MKVGRKIFITLFIAMMIACTCVGLYFGGVFGNFFSSPRNFTITFVNGTETVGGCVYTVDFKSVDEPEVPHKDGYLGEWEDYDLSLGGDIVVKPVYTAIDYKITFIGNNPNEIIAEYTYNIEGKTDYNYKRAPEVPSQYGFTGEWPEDVVPLAQSASDFTFVGRFGDIIARPLYTSVGASKGLKYWAENSGECYVVGYDGTNNDVVIPEIYRNMTVIGIANREELDENGTATGNKIPAFNDVDSMLSITLPKTLRNIEHNSFVGCDKLVGIYNYTNETNESIELLVSSTNGGLLEVITPSSENKLFNEYEDFLFINNGGVNYLVDYRGEKDYISLPLNYNGSEYAVYNFALYKNSKIKGITIPNGAQITNIGNQAFADCVKLSSFDVGDYTGDGISTALYGSNNIQSLYSSSLRYTLYDDEILIEVEDNINKSIIKATKTATFPSTAIAKTIAPHAFANNQMEGELIIPDGYESIGESAFIGCNKITELTVENQTFLQDKWLGYYFGAKSHSLNKEFIPSELSTVYVNAGSVCDYAFYNADSIEIIEIGDEVVSVGAQAFGQCDNLKSIVIPFSGGGDYKLFSYFFDGEATSLTDITFTDNVSYVAPGALSGFNNVKNLYIPFIGDTVANNDAYTFSYIFGASWDGTCVPQSLKQVFIRNGALVEGAFQDCSSITSIQLPNVDTAPNYAFYGCSSLKRYPTTVVNEDTITIAFTKIGDQAFVGCENLPQILPFEYNGLTYLGYNAFEGAITPKVINGGSYLGLKADGEILEKDNLYFALVKIDNSISTFTTEESVNIIASGVAEGCENLYTVKLTANIKNITEYAFSTAPSIYEIYNVATAVSDTELQNAFNVSNVLAYHDNLTDESCVYNDTSYGMIYVKDTGFNEVHLVKNATNDKKIVKLQIPSKFDADTFNISSGVFGENSVVEELTINSSVEIGYNAFYECTNLKSLTLNYSSTIGESAFANCTALKKVEIVALSTVNANAFQNCRSLTEFKGKLSSLGRGAFANCTSLLDVALSGNLSEISEYTFSNCSSLRKVDIQNSVATICGFAFENCINLGKTESIALPIDFSRVKTIETSAFINTQFKEVFINKSTTVYDNAFANDNGYQGLIFLIEQGATNVSSIQSAAVCVFENVSTGEHCEYIFDLGDGVAEPEVKKQWYLTPNDFTIPTREGYEFTGWYVNSVLVDNYYYYSSSATIKFVAGWKKVETV